MNERQRVEFDKYCTNPIFFSEIINKAKADLDTISIDELFKLFEQCIHTYLALKETDNETKGAGEVLSLEELMNHIDLDKQRFSTLFKESNDLSACINNCCMMYESIMKSINELKNELKDNKNLDIKIDDCPPNIVIELYQESCKFFNVSIDDKNKSMTDKLLLLLNQLKMKNKELKTTVSSRKRTKTETETTPVDSSKKVRI